MSCSPGSVCLMAESGIFREDDHKTVIHSAERKQRALRRWECDKRGAPTSSQHSDQSPQVFSSSLYPALVGGFDKIFSLTQLQIVKQVCQTTWWQ